MSNTEPPHRRGRHLVVCDIENIAGTPNPSPELLEEVIRKLGETVPGFNSAQRVWACSHRAARTVAFAVRRDRQLWQSGADGADLALLQVLETERIEERYEQVTICSGDGIFANSVTRLVNSGVTVGVAAVRGHVSARLRLEAKRVTYLPESDSALGTAS